MLLSRFHLNGHALQYDAQKNKKLLWLMLSDGISLTSSSQLNRSILCGGKSKKLKTTISWWKITMCDSMIVALDFIDWWVKKTQASAMLLSNGHLFQTPFCERRMSTRPIAFNTARHLALTELVYFLIVCYLITTHSRKGIEGKSGSVTIIWHTQSRSSCTAQETVS